LKYGGIKMMGKVEVLVCNTMIKFKLDLTPAPLLEERGKFGETFN